VEDKWGEPVDPQKLEDALKKHKDAKLVAFVHAETSTGCQSDAQLLTQIAHKHGALVIVDAVTSLGGTPVKVDEWEIDAVYSASHQRHYFALKAGLESMGLKFLVREQDQLPQMNAVMCPEGVDEAKVRSTLLTEFGLEIGAGLGPLKGKVWRFGLMGYSCRPDNVMLCLAALGSVLNDMALPVHVGDAEAAAHGAYAQMHVKEAQRRKRAA